MKSETNPKKIVVVSNRVHRETQDLLEEHFEVIINEKEEPFDDDNFKKHLASADALLAFMTDRVDKNFLENAPRLQMISAALKGFDNFDLQEIEKRKIRFCHVPDLLSQPTAELALALTLSLLRNLKSGHERVFSGKFQGWRPVLFGKTLFNARVGIIGMGGVGQELAKLLQPFHCKVFYYDQQPINSALAEDLQIEYREKTEIHKDVDILYPLVSLTKDTFHWVNENILRETKSGMTLVNVGRGSLVDEKAVLHHLKTNHLGGYAADVFEMEDWAIAHRPTQIDSALLAHSHTYFTPHLGSAVDDIRRQISNAAAQKIVDYFHG